MEEYLFPRPAVAETLAKSYVEARLHADTHGPARARNLELQSRYSGSVSLPTYVIVDPKSGNMISRTRGLKPEPAFLEFLRKGLQ